ncbi:hypothetical protein BWQ96_10298 [Gracilariopsis chorda]|uniref:Uncharacterized protein n=1 Tax=Gracilariopsis chorda TaxID=448386 RepID=A0A2V3ID29_9FLOR|nr:hypothetical protein BWQ96_10298 [Gracilariopsis chorda]|eukprot:PXF39993.1 hypothetical protein BWQ96_10298 [Gracilariopsis chorda]
MKFTALACMAALCSALILAAPAPDRPATPESDLKESAPDMIGPYVIRADVDAGFAGTPEPTHVFEEITVSPPPEMMITPSPEVEDDMYRYMSSGALHLTCIHRGEFCLRLMGAKNTPPLLQILNPQNRKCSKSLSVSLIFFESIVECIPLSKCSMSQGQWSPILCAMSPPCWPV